MCDIGANKKYILGLYPSFWHRVSKTLEISQVIKERGVSFVCHNKALSTIPGFMLMRYLTKGPRYQDGGRLPEELTLIRGLELSAPPSDI